MEIKQFQWGDIDSNSWLITDRSDGLLIDAVDSHFLYDAIGSLSSLTVILTHCHFDHISGLNRIRVIRPDVKVISTKLCSEFIGDKYHNLSSAATAFMSFYKGGEHNTFISPFECKTADIMFEGKKWFPWMGHSVSLYSVYGHSADGLIAIVDDWLFSGDTLLSIPTTTRFPTGNENRFRNEDIPLLTKLKHVSAVYPGHGEMRSLDDLLSLNEVR